MHNLNDYYYYVQVVKYQGFTKASEGMGIAKSKLSRHISELEERLGVRLIQRNTRKFAVTDLGQQFYQRCVDLLAQVVDIEQFIHSTKHDELCGNIRVSCPVALVQMPIGQIITDFMLQNPQVNIELIATNEKVDIIEQNIDLAIRVRNQALENSDLIMRELDAWEHVLVASPKLWQKFNPPTQLQEIELLPTIGFHRPQQQWQFRRHDQTHNLTLNLHSRLKTDHFFAIKLAMLQGIGIAVLPKIFVKAELASGEIEQLFPEWQLPQGVIYVAYASRQGMPPAIRLLLEQILQRFKAMPNQIC